MWNSYLCTLRPTFIPFFFWLLMGPFLSFSLLYCAFIHWQWDTITVLKVKWTKRFLSNLEKKLLTIFVSNLLFSVCYSTIKKKSQSMFCVSTLNSFILWWLCFLHVFFFYKKPSFNKYYYCVYHYYSISISDV